MVRKTLTGDELSARAKTNGYQRGAHRDKDSLRDQRKHITKTKKDQNKALNRYVLWHHQEMKEDAVERGLPIPDEAVVRGRFLRENVEAPDLATVKDFLRFQAATGQGMIVEQTTCDSLNTFAEWFFAGFTRVTGTPTDAGDRSEVYNFVRTVLVEEGVVAAINRVKQNFTERDAHRILKCPWTQDLPIFISHRSRIQFHYILLEYCRTGARLNAFFTGGLRYEDIDLALQRVPTGGWRIIYQIKQRWVKNNRNPKTKYYGTAAKEHPKLLYNSAAYFINMAIADNALFGIESVEDFRALEIPTGEDELMLSFTESALKRPILRQCIKGKGITEEPMSEQAFLRILRAVKKKEGYFDGASMHQVRRGLGKKIDERYTEVQRSQHLTQSDPRIFGASYTANCSSVEGLSAFLNEDTDHRHVEYFQGLERFREPGLPNELPAHRTESLTESLKEDPRVLELEQEIQRLEKVQASQATVSKAKRKIAQYRRSQYREALAAYQKEWVRLRRESKILSRGKQPVTDISGPDQLQTLCLLIPELGRLATWMASDDALSPTDMWQAIRDLHSLLLQDSTVLYLPGRKPVQGACPVAGCQRNLTIMPKSQHDRHIGVCVRKELAGRHKRLLRDVHYCYLCFDWIVGDTWNDHCQSHLYSTSSKRCGSITFCHTLIRPAFCPFCLVKNGLPAAKRLDPWTRDHHLWTHVNEHVDHCVWPRLCPHLLCDTLVTDAHGLWEHLIDQHDLSYSRPDSVSSRKRKHGDGAEFLEWKPENGLSSSKRGRPQVSTISPRLLSEPTSAASRVDETECPRDLDLHDTHLDGYMETGESPHLKPTDTYSTDDNLFSEWLRSPSPACTSIGEFSGCSSDTAVDPVTDEALLKPSVELLSAVPDPQAVRTDGQSRAATKPTRIRLRLNPPSKRPQGTKVMLRLKGPKPDKGARKGRKKA